MLRIDESLHPVLIGASAIACPGVGCGPAFPIHSDEDLASFPDGAILIAQHSSPKFVVVMQKAQAIITDFGSVTGHMASLSREFRIPTLLDAKNATKIIPPGAEVTVDAFTGKVYLGRVPELLDLKMEKLSYLEGSPVYLVLKQVADLIVPLRLTDPKSPKFTPENCNSFHDIMRFVHEASYGEMFQISDLVSCEGGFAIKLLAPIPFDLYVIDLGGGISLSHMRARQATVDRVSSTPFKALLRGMLHEELRYLGPRPIELRGFFSVMSQQMFNPAHSGAERFGDRSYAIVSDKYLNFSSRVGYHYSILDSYCGQSLNKNYINFSFKGGAADDIRRNRRARAIALILGSIGFTVEVVGDRVDARYQKFEQALTEEKLEEIGKLLLFTRQMDMLMQTEGSVKSIAESFLSGNYHLEDWAKGAESQ
jgi:pyruvate,water dikinase